MDIIEIALIVDDLDQIESIDVTMEISDNDFARNYFYKETT